MSLCLGSTMSVSLRPHVFVRTPLIRRTSTSLSFLFLLVLGQLSDLLGISLCQEVLVEGLNLESFPLCPGVDLVFRQKLLFLLWIRLGLFLGLLLGFLYRGEIDAFFDPLLDQNFKLISQICLVAPRRFFLRGMFRR